MLREFIKNDEGYLDWVRNHQDGFIVSVDHDHVSPEYPMLHKASHKLLSSEKIENFTTGRFFKVCSDNVKELESWARSKRGRSLRPCGTCKP